MELNGGVTALAVSGSDLYAGGYFTNAGGIAANYIAKWNGSNGSALGSGLNGAVRSLAVSGGELYVGGDFRTAGGSAAYYIAKWNGNSWSALGLGMDTRVYALAVSGSDLYAGGWFGKAGGKMSPYLARARIGSRARSVTNSNGTATLRFSGVTGYAYDVQRTTSFTPPITWTTVTTTPLYPAADGSFNFHRHERATGERFLPRAAYRLRPVACSKNRRADDLRQAQRAG